jgi:hypothetical protein
MTVRKLEERRSHVLGGMVCQSSVVVVKVAVRESVIEHGARGQKSIHGAANHPGR